MRRTVRVAATAAVLLVSLSCSGDDADAERVPVAGAELLAGGGETSLVSLAEDSRRADSGALLQPDYDTDQTKLTDLNLQGPAGSDLGGPKAVVSDRDDGFWLLHERYLVHISDDQVDYAAPDAQYADEMTADRRDGVAIATDNRVALLSPGREAQNIVASFDEIGSLAFAEDGALFVGDRNASRIDSYAPDSLNGNPSHLLGFEGEEAEVLVDFGETPITSLTPLADGRLAFLTGRRDHFELRIIDGSRTALVDVDRSDVGDDELTGITAGPDSQLLATFGSQAALVDVDTGDTEVLTDLEVETWPGSVTLSDDDLVFIADERLWRKPDVID